MTSSEPPDGARARRSRRAIRRAGTVGGDDANLVSTHPVIRVETPRDDARRDAVAGGGPASGRAGDDRPSSIQAEPVIATRSADDSDVGWGDREAGSNDDRLHQDRPPHW